jgi:DNA-binding CsgD family transcriptional regulator
MRFDAVAPLRRRRGQCHFRRVRSLAVSSCVIRPRHVHNLDMANQGRPREVGISAREAEVLAALGEHLTNAEIGARLFISIRTVESHVSSLLRKLQADDRRALAAVAGNLYSDPAAGPAAPIAVAAVLPSPLTPFVGRLAERAALTAALHEHRLVTAVGRGRQDAPGLAGCR